jgi:hypothetical protein
MRNWLDPSAPAPIWLIWPYLSWLERFSFLTLCLVAVWSLYLAATVLHARSTASVPENLVRIRKRIGNLRQATVAVFYFFGFVLFTGFLNAYFVIDNSKIPTDWIVVGNFQIHFAFAGNVFFLFLTLHLFQWFVVNRVGALGSRANSLEQPF